MKTKIDYHRQLKLIRIFSNLNQSDMCKILETSQGWISKLDQGLGAVDAKYLALLEEKLNIDPCDFIHGDLDYAEMGDLSGAITTELSHLGGTVSGDKIRAVYDAIAKRVKPHQMQKIAKIAKVQYKYIFVKEVDFPAVLIKRLKDAEKAVLSKAKKRKRKR